MSRLKIAFVVDRFGSRYGGAEAYGVALMRELARDHDVTVYARSYDRACGLDLPFVRLALWSGWPSWLRVLLFARRVARLTRGRYDIVHSHVNGDCGDVEVVHVTPVRYNWKVRSLPWHKRLLAGLSPRVGTYLALERRRVAQRPGHRTVAVSGLIAQQLRTAYGEELQAPVIPPGVSRAPEADPAQRLRMRNEMGWSEADRVCLLVARNPMRKGLPTVAAALAALPPHYKLLVVGGRALAREFLDAHADAALRARIGLVDTTSDVAGYYRAADLYVHPTLNDSFGMAPLEAMSFGLPVILSPSPWCGFAQYVEAGREALVLPHPEDAQELARAIALVCEDGALRASLVQGGARVVERHSWAEAARRYASLYEEILAEKGGDTSAA
jgi:UDP-glucose:(heptosyl)LPS alpha-1,3-glucosyltransferase